MIINYETFQAAQILKKYGFEITLTRAEKIGQLIKECGIIAVENKIHSKKIKNDLHS